MDRADWAPKHLRASPRRERQERREPRGPPAASSRLTALGIRTLPATREQATEKTAFQEFAAASMTCAQERSKGCGGSFASRFRRPPFPS